MRKKSTNTIEKAPIYISLKPWRW